MLTTPTMRSRPPTTKSRIKTSGRSPVAAVEGELFLDVIYGHGAEIEVDFSTLAHWLARQNPKNILVARRLSHREVQLLREAEVDAHDEVYGKFESDLRRKRLGVVVP